MEVGVVTWRCRAMRTPWHMLPACMHASVPDYGQQIYDLSMPSLSLPTHHLRRLQPPRRSAASWLRGAAPPSTRLWNCRRPWQRCRCATATRVARPQCRVHCWRSLYPACCFHPFLRTAPSREQMQIDLEVAQKAMQQREAELEDAKVGEAGGTGRVAFMGGMNGAGVGSAGQ